VCRVLNVSRSNIAARHGRRSVPCDRGRPPVEDPHVLEQLREVASQRPTYGYRRLWVMLNRLRREQGLPAVNAKRVYHNGMAEAFVKTFKRDYVRVNPTPDAPTVLAQLSAWFADYNAVHPHSALRYRSPDEFRSEQVSPKSCPVP